MLCQETLPPSDSAAFLLYNIVRFILYTLFKLLDYFKRFVLRDSGMWFLEFFFESSSKKTCLSQ
jgi:hypothetical protein